jgi:hypothetical protein
MSVAPWGVQIPASEMPGGRFYEYYSWQMPIQYVNGETVNVTAAGLPEGLSVSPTGLVSGYPREDVHPPVVFTVTARPVGAPWVIEKTVSLPLTIWWH